jgi:divalent metal cation (Fe/Co/Zn/Cd) transporter
LGSEDGRLPEQLQSEAQAGGHGTKAVVVALLANLGIAVAKFVGYLVTGASSMLAEALHSVADSGNQAMLLAGGRLARRGPDPGHHFGHGRVRYFAAFLVAVVLFTLGSLFSLYVQSAEFDRLLVATVQRAFPPHEHEQLVAYYHGLVGALANDQRTTAGQA